MNEIGDEKAGSEPGAGQHRGNKEMVFRYGWRTLAVNLAGCIFLGGFAMVVGMRQLPQNMWALVLVLLGSSLLVVRFVLEQLNPREFRISDGQLHFRLHGKETSIPLTELHMGKSDAYSVFLDFTRIGWSHGSFLVFPHLSDFKALQREVSGS